MKQTKDAMWLRDRLGQGKTVLGSHVFCGAPMLTEAIALAGFDMIWIDMEHTSIGKEAVLNNLIAVRSGGAASLVRIPWNDPVLAKPILDMGPDALLFPYIRSVSDARLVVSACEYPPRGIRGYGPLRALEYGRHTPIEYVDSLHKNMLRIVQIEHIDAIHDLDAILDVEGIDAFIVGPNDLAGSVGQIGRTDVPEMMPIYDEIAMKMVRAGRPFGVSTGLCAETLNQWKNRGAQIIFSGHDSGYVFDGAKSALGVLKKITNSTEP